MKEQFNLYKAEYFYSKKYADGQMGGGFGIYLVSALTNKEAKDMAMDKFHKEFTSDKTSDKTTVTVKIKKKKTPKMIKLIDSGVLELNLLV